MSEVAEILRRMRKDEFRNRNGEVLPLPAREYHADLIEFMVATGIRTGELTRLTVSDVDMKKNTASIIAKDRANPREASIPQGLRPAVKRIVEYANRNNGGRFLPTGVAYLANLFKAWQRRLDMPRLNGRRLRQTAITSVIESGGSLLEAKDFAGHTKVTTTALYVEAVEDRKAEVADRHYRRLNGGDNESPDENAA